MQEQSGARWRGWVGAAVGLVLIGLVWIGAFGAYHRAFDSLAMLRPGFVLICVVALIWVQRKWLRLGLLISALWGAGTIAAVHLPQAPGGDLRVYSKNLWYQNRQAIDVAGDILEADPDAVFLQELTRRNKVVLEALRPDYPYQHVCWFRGGRVGIAVLSKTAFVGQGRCSRTRVAAFARIEVSGTRIWLGSLHIYWPWPMGYGPSEAELMEMLEDLDGPVVLGGDFNILPWSGRVGRIASATGTRLAGPGAPTLTLKGLPIMIDMVLAPRGGQMEVRPKLGSDHAGVLADVGL